MRESFGADVIVASLLCLFVPTAVEGQATPAAGEDSQRQGAVPDASFEAFFRKYTPPANVFSPFAAWDAHLALNATAFRKGPSAVEFAVIFQTVGIDTPGSRIGVAGTGYVARLGYVRTRRADLNVAVGVIHLSSHLTRDLDQRLDRARSESTPIPVVQDPPEYNVPYLQIVRRFPGVRFRPELDLRIQPVNIGAHDLYDVRPVYVGLRLMLWRSASASIALETQHEFGINPLNNVLTLVELHNRDQAAGRLQFFVSASPGRDVHVSPNLGGLRDGLAFGVRLKFRAAP